MGNIQAVGNYILLYKNLYESKFGKKNDFDIQNFSASISKYFDFDIYLEVMNKIHQDLPEDKEAVKYQNLKTLKNDLFDIANKVYFQKFYEEVSLEEKVRADGFSFDVSIFKPLKRSVLFN